MKTKILFILLLSLSFSTFAQNGFNYKAVLTDNDAVLQNQTVQLQLSLLDAPSGTLIYQERQTTTTDAHGIVSVILGEGDTVLVGYFPDIDWSQQLYLHVQIDFNGGNTFTDFGTEKLNYVPYAQFAKHVFSVDYSQITGVPANLDTDTTDDVTELGDLDDARTDRTWRDVFVGEDAGHESVEGGIGLDNTGVGYNALYKGFGRTGNTALGSYAGYYSGYNCTAIGFCSLRNNAGSRNTAIGAKTGWYSSGSDNVFIGYQAGKNATVDNKLFIENTDSATPLIGGDFAEDYVVINGKMGIGLNTNPTGRLNIIPIDNLNSGSTLPNMDNAGLLIGTAAYGIAMDANQIESVGTNLYINHNTTNDVFLTTGGGNVGIGTSSPGEKLQVTKTDDNVGVKIIGGDGKKSKLQLMESGNYGYELEYDGAHDKLNLWSRHYTGNEAIHTTWKKNGEVEINGKITATATGSNDLKAFAYGIIASDGSIISGTGNFSVDTGAGTGVKKITFSGETYDDQHFITVVSLNKVYTPAFILSYAAGDMLVVKTFDADGSTLENDQFSFVTYKK